MMTPALRRFTFTTHITSSVGWVGAALAFLALAVIGFTTDDPVKARGAYLLMAPAALVNTARVPRVCLSRETKPRQSELAGTVGRRSS